MEINNKLMLGIQSWSLRGLEDSNKDVIKALKECNIDCLEITGAHVDFKNPIEVDEVIALYKDNNITLTSCGVCSFSNDETENRYIFDFAKKAGIKAISAYIEMDAFDICEKLCKEYDIKLALHNHGKKDAYGTFEKIDAAITKSSKNIGLCIDLAWMMDAGHDPVEALKRYEGRVYGIHFKDFIMKEDGVEEVVLGIGDLDLKSCVNVIKNTDTILYASIEYEENDKNPIPDIKKCIVAVKEILNS